MEIPGPSNNTTENLKQKKIISLAPVDQATDESSGPNQLGLMALNSLYTTLPHNLIKEKLLDSIERTFYKKKGKQYPLVMIRKRISLLQTIIEDITLGLVRMYVTPNCSSWTIFILGLALSYTDKLLVFRLVQIVLLL